MYILVNFFEGCNEGIMDKETEGRGSTGKWGEAPLEGVVCGLVGWGYVNIL